MKHYLFPKLQLAIALLFVVSLAIAGPVDVKTARNTAERFFNAELGKTATSRKAIKNSAHVSLLPLGETALKTHSASKHPEYYVFTPEDSIGFVIVAGDDEVEPIVGYSLNAKFSNGQLPDALVKYLESYKFYVNKIRSGEELPKHRTKTNVKAIKPFITTTWNQSYPYNYYTPTIGGKRTLAGCFAIAISQIMRYYEWPAAGKGTCIATLNDGYDTEKYITLGQEYDWSNMLDNYSNSYKTTEMTAAARLIRDAGYACYSSYGTSTTWAYNIHALMALLRHFYYSPDIRLVDRMYYSDESWNAMLQKELSSGRPVWFCGQDENGTGGHSFICCGMDTEGRYYINWGWGGSYDGYFDMNAFSPGKYKYNAEQQAIINIRPMEEGENEDDFSLIPHVGNLDIVDQDNSLLYPRFTYNIYVSNTSDHIISGSVGVSIWGENNIDPSEVTKVNYYEGIELNWWWRYQLDLNLYGPTFKTPGVKEIRFLWQPEGSNDWFTPLGENNVIYMKTTDTGHYFYTERPETTPNSIIETSAEEYEFKIVKGGIAVTVPTSTNIKIHSINGMLLRKVYLRANATQIIHLPQGIYIVNGKRVVVQ